MQLSGLEQARRCSAGTFKCSACSLRKASTWRLSSLPPRRRLPVRRRRSAFLRNLSFDVEGQTTPGARIQWTGAHVEIEGNVRLRGTWDRPILLGNIHLLGGQMAFRGNKFDLTRGDINFANPFRLDPVLNVEATSTISQYQVTIDFSGPASRLSLNYRSDPPLPDSDIIALLALGSPGKERDSVGVRRRSQNYGATALLSEAISSGLGGRIEHLFGISQFRVDPFVAGTATESNAAARVTIQQQVARDLTITYSTNAATTNQYQLIQVEYALRRELSVDLPARHQRHLRLRHQVGRSISSSGRGTYELLGHQKQRIGRQPHVPRQRPLAESLPLLLEHFRLQMIFVGIARAGDADSDTA